MVNWENTEYVNPRQRKMKDLETGKIYTFEIQDDPDNIVKQSQTPVRAENLNKMQTDLVDDMSKNYTGTTITANTVEGFGTINKLYGDTVQTGTGDKSPDNPYKIECIGDDINLLSDIEKVNASMGSGVDFYGITYFVQVEPSTDYIISFRTSIGYQLSEYNNDKTFIKQEAKNFNTKFTTSANTYYIKFRTNRLVSDFSSVPLIKLQKGAIATPYSPPNKGTVVVKSSNSSNTSSNIVYVDRPLCCLKDAEGNIVLQDYIDYKREKVVRQCGYKILNGSETWSTGGFGDWENKNHLFWTKINDIAESNYNISNQFTLTSDINAVVHNTSNNNLFIYYTSYSSSYNILFLDQNCDSVEAFKQKLAKNNMILIYKLATPVEEDIECTDKIVQYADSTTIQSDAKVEVTLTNNKVISQIYEDMKIINDYTYGGKVIGRWLNGKDLYRKVIITNAPAVATDGTYVSNNTHIADNIDNGLIEFGYVVGSNGQRQPLPYTNNSGRMIKAFVDTDKTLYLTSNGTTYNNASVLVSVLYTKN